MTRPRVLIVGAGFAGFHCARELERLLRPEEAELTLAELELGNAVGDEQRRAAHCTFVVAGAGYARVVTRGYHLYALPSPRARVRTAADWLMHTALGDDFTRLVLPDPMSGMLAGQEPAGQYLSADDTRQTAERILAHDQGGWPT